MRITLVSVGTKMPGWIQHGVEEYGKRIKGSLGFSLTEIPLAQRGKSANTMQSVEKEGKAILAKVQKNDFVIALEVEGTRLSTGEMARRLEEFKTLGQNIVFVSGGPDGLHASCRERANEQWSLSDLTLPHPLVRIILVEQLYRATSLLEGHPYHRE
ncbi:MAG: 23S rRNA (pseudouridine(1915)-N(3))-methyltransferase RlmH [Gammaproteobacteria bacterium]|nr:23S rRNA (pseudouridine(1915)-N(3))-methyltransferase RlmH [Gammaproteobacteria bacterium]MDD9896000.1 23S rRNA (pseudouridine(1915)-N(3))-methyltransferase RlmH [Gammaproteobacteria bacterium]MDD9957927.1 23S rRNA (pseudouridine(1915)-N(3))-methyltransferase RlmH [Gammaproteobacteria bacterium]